MPDTNAFNLSAFDFNQILSLATPPPAVEAPRARFRGSYDIDGLTFGRLGGETEAFSKEHNYALKGTIKIDARPEKRRLCLYCVGLNPIAPVRLWIKFGQIEQAFFLRNSNKHVLLILKYAPRIDIEGQRQSSFRAEHARMAQVLNRHLLVSCATDGERMSLEKELKHCLGSYKTPKVHVGLIDSQSSFSEQNMARVKRLMSELSGPVGFKIEDLLNDGSVTPAQVMNLASLIRNIELDRGPKVAERVLIKFADNLRRPKRLAAGKAQPKPTGPTLSMADQLRLASSMVSDTIDGKLVQDTCMTRFATVTATGIDLDGPQVEQSNTTLRLYGNNSDNFLRVSFREEDHELYYLNEDYEVAAFIRQRFKTFLLDGITIGGRRYDFYACSSNGLRDQQAVFVHEFKDENGRIVNASTMRESCGDFTKCEKNPAKLLSRLGQTLSTTQFGATLADDEIEWLDDIYTPNHEYCFTDGCGTISQELAREIDARLDPPKATTLDRAAPVPTTCFQIRLGGAKGMLSIDPLLVGRKVRLRKSMEKFVGTSRTLDIAKRFSFPSRAFTNKSLIQILEALGVPLATMLALQKEAIDKTVAAKSDCSSFVDLLTIFGLGLSARIPTTLGWLISSVGLDPNALLEDSFNAGLVDLATLHSLRELKFRARIPLPTDNHFNLVGVADEDGFLEEGEVYVCIHDRGKAAVCLDGVIAVSRSPSNHPGDVQRARAVGRVDKRLAPRLAAQENCIVFSVKGARPLPSMLSGGDLDGDLFLVSAVDLVPPQSVEAASYEAAKPVELARAANKVDMIDFFVNHTIANCVGQLANLIVHQADFEVDGMFSSIVAGLAEKFSHAIDSSKSGREIDFKSLPHAPDLRPDFIQNERNYSDHEGRQSHQSTYESQRANGHLFRAIGTGLLNPKDLKDFGAMHKSKEKSYSLVTALLASQLGRSFPPAPALVDEVEQLIEPFTDNLHALSNSISPHRRLTEQEILLATIAASYKSNKAKGELTEQLIERGGHIFHDLRDQLSGDEELHHTVRIRRVWAAIEAVDRHGVEWGVRSFVWIALSELRIAFEAAREAEEARKA